MTNSPWRLNVTWVLMLQMHNRLMVTWATAEKSSWAKDQLMFLFDICMCFQLVQKCSHMMKSAIQFF